MLSGYDLIRAGIPQQYGFAQALSACNIALSEGRSVSHAINIARDTFKKYNSEKPIQKSLQNVRNVEVLYNNDYTDSHDKVLKPIAKTPYVHKIAVFPNITPMGVGKIPNGCVVESEKIHPGLHSRDVCNSIMISVFDSVDCQQVFNAVRLITSFSSEGREQITQPSEQLLDNISNNKILSEFSNYFTCDFMTQGGSGHFAIVGKIASTYQTVLITSCGLGRIGNKLHDIGSAIAKDNNCHSYKQLVGDNYWLEPESKQGNQYWSALQLVRDWAEENQKAIHDSVARLVNADVVDQFWEYYNFIYKRVNGLYYHGRGVVSTFEDTPEQRKLIFLNIGATILIVKPLYRSESLDFIPCNSGTIKGIKEYEKIVNDKMMFTASGYSQYRHNINNFLKKQVGNIDVRFETGITDPSEYPGRFNSADNFRKQLRQLNLASVVQYVVPSHVLLMGKTSNNKR